jgi:hypothetical protein
MAGAHDAGIDYGVLAADIAADNMAAHIAAVLQSADAVMGGQQPDRGGMTMPDAPFKYEPQGPLPGGAVPMAPGGPAAQPQPYRQLKVEDALAYLDQVKMKFEKQPQIYNKVCACARAPCLDGACAARRCRVAPGAIVMDTLVRASRTRTRRLIHEISRARASCGSSSTS